MKYTPSELVNYIFENTLEMQVLNAAMNNHAGYQSRPVEGIIEEIDGKYYFTTDLGIKDAEKQKIEMLDLQDDIRESAMAHPEWIFAIMRIYGTEGNLFITCHKDEIERTNRTFRLLFEDFIRNLNIDTVGRLKKYISDGEQMVSGFAEFVQKYNITEPF